MKIQLAEARLLFARWRDAAAARPDEARRAAQAAEAQASSDAQVETEGRPGRAGIARRQARRKRADELADRRDDAQAHGHRMASLTTQLESAEERLKDLDRQKARLEEDRGEADRLTKDAAEALKRLSELEAAEKALLADEERRPAIALAVERNESAVAHRRTRPRPGNRRPCRGRSRMARRRSRSRAGGGAAGPARQVKRGGRRKPARR